MALNILLASPGDSVNTGPFEFIWGDIVENPAGAGRYNISPTSANMYYNGNLYYPKGQSTGAGRRSDIGVFDTSSPGWSSIPDPDAQTRVAHSVALLGGKVYTFGGRDQYNAGVLETRIYDIESAAWSYGTPAPYTLINSPSAVDEKNGRVYILRVVSSTGTLFVYDTITDTWTEAISPYTGNPVPTVTTAPASVLAFKDGVLYTASISSSTLYKYDLKTDSGWTSSGTVGKLTNNPQIIIGDYWYIFNGYINGYAFRARRVNLVDGTIETIDSSALPRILSQSVMGWDGSLLYNVCGINIGNGSVTQDVIIGTPI